MEGLELRLAMHLHARAPCGIGTTDICIHARLAPRYGANTQSSIRVRQRRRAVTASSSQTVAINSLTSKQVHRDALLATSLPPCSHSHKTFALTTRSRRSTPQPKWPTDSLPSRSSIPAVSSSQPSTSLDRANFEPKSRQTLRAHPKRYPPTLFNSSRSPSSARTPSSSRPLRTTMATTTTS